MILRFAPLEGLTNITYRSVYQKHFGGVDVFYAPFVTATHTHSFQTRERKEFQPFQANVVPQIMTKNAEVFLPSVLKVAAEGYHEININLGCPAPTAVTKGRGAGMLKDPSELDRFFDQVFRVLESRESIASYLETLKEDPYLSNLTEVMEAYGKRSDAKEAPIPRISIKTRAGLEDHRELEELNKVFARYPFERIILHARVREEYYNGEPTLESYQRLKEAVSCPTCYNGDLWDLEAVERLLEAFPGEEELMIGRGFLADPTLPRQIKTGVKKDLKDPREREELREFLEDLKNTYRKVLSGDKDVHFKMTDLWFYVGRNFPGCEKELKQIRRSKSMKDYDAAVNAIFRK